MATIYVTIVQCPNQEVDISKMCVNSSCDNLGTPMAIKTQNYSITMKISLMWPFVISKMLQQWHHTVCDLLRMTFFTQILAWDPSKLLQVSLICSCLLLSMVVPVYIIISPVKDVWVVFSFLAITDKATMNIQCIFLCGLTFLFL